jgi:hypothetical protein
MTRFVERLDKPLVNQVLGQAGLQLRSKAS